MFKSLEFLLIFKDQRQQYMISMSPNHTSVSSSSVEIVMAKLEGHTFYNALGYTCYNYPMFKTFSFLIVLNNK
jgi:hypothetical protein